MTRKASAPRPSSPKLPRELEHAMQGLAYWLGYVDGRYPKGDLPSEGAMVDELAALLCGAVGTFEQRGVVREKCISDILGKDGVFGHQRVDLVVTNEVSGKRRPLYIVEVKRSSASTSAIEEDLERLAAIREAGLHDCRGFVLIVGAAAKGLIDRDTCMAVRKGQQTEVGTRYHVRRAVRAHGAVEASVRSGHWVTALEVG